MNKFIFSCLLLFFCFSGVCQQRFFSGYSISDGLSQSVVNCVFQDSRGFMWFGTQNGLNRFDGYAFEVFIYHPNDTTSISNNWIYAITEDRQGNLWVGTKGGLNRYITREKRFERIRYSTPFPENVTEYIYDVKTSTDGSILINTPPVLSVCDPQTMEFRHFISPLPSDESVKDWNIPLWQDPGGKIWIGSARGLACFYPDSGKFEFFRRDLPPSVNLTGQLISALFRDNNGKLWIGTPSGLFCYREKENTLLVYRNIPGDRSSPSNNFIRAIDGKTRMTVGATHVLNDGDVIKIVART